MIKYDNPSCFVASISVRAKSKPQCALCALVVHTFCPLTTHLLPTITAFVVAPAKSEPLPGSLKSWHHTSSPVTMRLRNFSLCISVPWFSIVAAANIRIPDLGMGSAPMRWNSSSTIGTKPTGRSRPYQSEGQFGNPQPESANLFRHSKRSKFGSQLFSNHVRASLRT